jgi:hypothetical protein
LVKPLTGRQEAIGSIEEVFGAFSPAIVPMLQIQSARSDDDLAS